MTDAEIVALMYAELRRQAKADPFDAPWVSTWGTEAATGTVQVDGDIDLASLLAVVKAALQ